MGISTIRKHERYDNLVRFYTDVIRRSYDSIASRVCVAVRSTNPNFGNIAGKTRVGCRDERIV